MSIREEMERELEACQKEFEAGNNFVQNREVFLKRFFPGDTQKSLLSTTTSELTNVAGAAGGMLAANTLFASQLGLVGTLLGAATPVGWLVIGAGAGYMGLKMLNKGKQKIDAAVYCKTAKFIGVPMDAIARGLCQLTMPIVLAAVHADGEVKPIEMESIKAHFVNSWGLHPNAVDLMLSEFNGIDWDEWDSMDLLESIELSIKDLTKNSKGIDEAELKKSVCTSAIELVSEVVKSDGEMHGTEKRFLKRLSADLGYPNLAVA